MKLQLKKAETSVILIVFIQNSSLTTGAGLGSLDQTSSITGGYVKRNGTGVALAVDENVTTEGTYEAPSTAGQVRIGTPANMPTGFYELHFHNDLFTTADYVTIGLGGATNMAPLNIEVQLVTNDLNTDPWTTALTEAYAADGAAFTPAQALYMIWARHGNFKDADTTTPDALKLDGSTVAMTFTTDSAASPTEIIRSA